jgi:tetratricopeptide (TPR) repeat protein
MSGERGWAVRAAVGGALILAGAGAGVAGAFAASTSGLVRAVSAAVGAVAGLAAAIWADRAYQRREAREAAVRARADVLDALVADPPGEGSVFDVLLATSTGAAPFRGRRADLAWLGRWWDDPKQPLVVVTGPAGVGKTRLVTQFAQDRPEPWVAGWLAVDRGADAVAAVRACGDPALILVDDADQRSDLAALLANLNTASGTRPLVQVILISRAKDLVSRLAPVLDDRSRGMLSGVRELPLGSFGGADDRARWFGEAVRAYATARQTPPPDLPGHLSGSITDPAEPILTLQAQALLTVLDSEGSRPMRPRVEGLSFDQVAAELFAHELHRWEDVAKRPEFGLIDFTRVVQERAIAALLLVSPTDHEQAAKVLRRVPELRNATAERRANIARWAAHLYPGEPQWPIQIKPDMLAEWLVVTQLTHTPELAASRRGITPVDQAGLLVLLAHASDHMPQAVQLFIGIVVTDTLRLAEAGVAAALTTFRSQWRLDSELSNLIVRTTWSADALSRVEGQLSGGLPRTRAAVAEARVKIARADGETADLAWALNNLGNRLGELGRDQEALAAAEEALGLLRELAQDNPGSQPGLAGALMNLGGRLGELGRHQDALAPAEEAVGLWRPLVQDNPGYQPNLAKALMNLGNRLANLGRHQDALAAAEEAVGLWRPLAQDNPGYQPDLATALNNLAIALNGPGRYQEAMRACEEAVGLWRLLVQDNPGYQPNLAKALDNLGIRLGGLDRHQDALAAAEEAVGLWRPLAQDNPAYQPDLAGALNNLGGRLSKLGRHQDALAAAEEAVDLYRELAQDNPGYQPDLALALNNVGVCLHNLGRQQEALAAAEEAVGLYRELAQANPGLYQEAYKRAGAQLRRKLNLRGQESAAILLHIDDGNPDKDKPAYTEN